MKKILLMVMMLMMSVIGIAAKTKVANKSFKGDYSRTTNTFVYIKDNLVFPNKTLNYTVKDSTGLLDRIYDFIGQKYGVTDEDIVNLDVNGVVSKDGVLTIQKINNYRIPEYKLHPELGYTAPPSSDVAPVTASQEDSLDNSNLNNDTGSFFNQETGN
ncbi:hypothetical protein [Leptotrichia sp. oral taxon 879]|uniref:hypothetical protein n=1 Tax=Leptotrichia sp. oral taxon 879 TaxID=1227267 RepID=UPI0003ADB741|nr:hypothetical protein [Leptotrichia sp. oral taxon 879]ERK49155.1 hypothetical protein HMPREF1552_01827 [Leptotrichia sp. oral taxon 879 str. F0557]